MSLIDRINAAKRNAAERAVLENLEMLGLGETPEDAPVMVTLETAVRGIVEKHGGVRAAATATGVDKAFISRLLNGKKTAPSDDTLRKLGLCAVPMYALLQSTQPATAEWPVRYVSRDNIKERVTDANPNPIRVHLLSEQDGDWRIDQSGIRDIDLTPDVPAPEFRTNGKDSGV